MRIHFLFRSIAFLAILTLLFLLYSCQEKDKLDNEHPTVIDPKEQGDVCHYQFEKRITVKDESGQYYVVVNVQSNSERLLEEAISAVPYITIAPSIDTTKSTNSMPLITTQIITGQEKNDILYHLTSDRNIPSNVTYTFHLGKDSISTVSATSKTSSGCGVPGDPIASLTLQDDAAVKVYTTNSTSCPIRFTYYSRGCCWYSFGYYDRGYRSLSNRASYTFDARTYTTSKGVKVIATRPFNLIGRSWTILQ